MDGYFIWEAGSGQATKGSQVKYLSISSKAVRLDIQTRGFSGFCLIAQMSKYKPYYLCFMIFSE